MTDYTRNGSSQYGASMGRRSTMTPLQARNAPTLTVRRVSLDEGGYDPGGAYWGTPSNLWLATDDEGGTLYFRHSGDPLALYPNATIDREPTSADAEAFARAYVECAEWVEEERLAEENAGRTPSDWDPESLTAMLADARSFYHAHAHMIPDANQGGHDLYLTRNGLGAGFWDRAHHTQEERNALTKASHALGESFLYVGDDGLIYLHN